MLFRFCTESVIHHDIVVAEHIPNGEKPDRVYGICHSKRIERLVDAVAKGEGNVLEYPVRITPSKNGDTAAPPLFPSLVLESKSEKASVDGRDVLLQTGFVIRTFLKLQNDLRNVAMEKVKWKTSSPFVWFLSHKGPYWEVAGAYAAPNKIHPHDDPIYVRPKTSW